MSRRSTPLAAALVLSLWMSLAPVQAQAVDPGAAVAVPDGMQTTFQRRSSGSFGNFDGQVPWSHKIIEWQGRPVVFASSPMGSNYVDLATHGQVASLNAAGAVTFTYDPPLAYRYPLKVGAKWTSEHKMTVIARNSVVPLSVSYEVVAYEDITVPAGTFKAFKVVTSDSFGETSTHWTAPSMSLATIKRVSSRPSSHPQGAGELVGELFSYKKP